MRVTLLCPELQLSIGPDLLFMCRGGGHIGTGGIYIVHSDVVRKLSNITCVTHAIGTHRKGRDF